MISVVSDDPAALKTKVEACSVDATFVLQGDANDPDAPTLWFPHDTGFDPASGACNSTG